MVPIEYGRSSMIDMNIGDERYKVAFGQLGPPRSKMVTVRGDDQKYGHFTCKSLRTLAR